MNIVILAGGNGERLKPALNSGESKPFVRAFKNITTNESICERNLRLIKEVYPDSNVIASTEKNKLKVAMSQLGNTVSYCVEPETRDTYAAIILACSYLDKNSKNDEDVIVVPSDMYVDKEFFNCFLQIENKLTDNINICLVGVKPSHPSDQFGYISEENGILKLIEKPDTNRADELIKNGAYWNAGIFSFNLKYMLNKIKTTFGTTDYDWIIKNYNKIPKTSFDYAIVEKEKNIALVKYDGNWNDIGRPETFKNLT